MSTRTWLPIRLVGRRGPMNLLTIRLDVRWSLILPLCLVWFRWRPLLRSLRSSFLFRSAMYFNSLEIGVLSYSFLLSYELLCVLLDEGIRSSRRQFIGWFFSDVFCHLPDFKRASIAVYCKIRMVVSRGWTWRVEIVHLEGTLP